MKILMIQERGRHEANREFRESENFRRSFKRIGVESEVWGINQPTFSTPFHEMIKDFDVIFVMENYDESGWLPDLSQITNKFKVFWSIDSHLALGQHVFFSKRAKFDLHLNSTEGYLKHFQRHSPTCLWFPNAYPDDLIDHIPHASKSHDVGFCGSLIGGRDRWLENISSASNKAIRRDVGVLGKGMVEAINSYKVALNQSLLDDINYRVFETLGTKTCLLTNSVPGLGKLFVPDKHLMTYNNQQELVEKLHYLLRKPEVVEKISGAGYDHVRANHTYDVRAKQLLEILKEKV